MKDQDDAPLFKLFWENSKFNRYTIIKYGNQLSEDARIAQNIPQLLYPTEDLKLTLPNDALMQVMSARASTRAFSSKPISERELGSLFAGFGQLNLQRRILPSAGGKYPIEVYAFLFNVTGNLNGKIVYYNPDNHSLSTVDNCPNWRDANKSFNLDVTGSPAIFFIFAAIAQRTTTKYGERGGRFILIETGHYAQNLALRLAQENLIGVECGSLFDDEVKRLLKLEKTAALITLGYACGKE